MSPSSMRSSLQFAQAEVCLANAVDMLPELMCTCYQGGICAEHADTRLYMPLALLACTAAPYQ